MVRETSQDLDQAREYVLKMVRENDVKFIRLWFTDILGALKGFAITSQGLEEALAEGVGFDGASIQGIHPHGRKRHGRHAGSHHLPHSPMAAKAERRSSHDVRHPHTPSGSPLRETPGMCSSVTLSGPRAWATPTTLGLSWNSSTSRAQMPPTFWTAPATSTRPPSTCPRSMRREDHPDPGGDGNSRGVQPPRGRHQPARD